MCHRERNVDIDYKLIKFVNAKTENVCDIKFQSWSYQPLGSYQLWHNMNENKLVIANA